MFTIRIRIRVYALLACTFSLAYKKKCFPELVLSCYCWKWGLRTNGPRREPDIEPGSSHCEAMLANAPPCRLTSVHSRYKVGILGVFSFVFSNWSSEIELYAVIFLSNKVFRLIVFSCCINPIYSEFTNKPRM